MDTSWLERLARATDYRQLSGVFAELEAAARRADDPERLADAIDEAILRIDRALRQPPARAGSSGETA